jgi:hypothetical protein
VVLQDPPPGVHGDEDPVLDEDVHSPPPRGDSLPAAYNLFWEKGFGKVSTFYGHAKPVRAWVSDSEPHNHRSIEMPKPALEKDLKVGVEQQNWV